MQIAFRFRGYTFAPLPDLHNSFSEPENKGQRMKNGAIIGLNSFLANSLSAF